MEFCPICTTSFDSDDRQIHCNGQRCNLAFHQRCVHLTEVHVRSWLDDDVGLFWYCPTCRLDIAPAASSSRVDGKHKLEAEAGEPSAIKRSRMDPSPRLPPEVWTMIFRHLASRELARVRLVCRDWNELVCTRSELMDRFLLKLGTAQFVDDLDEVRHFLALGGGFTRAEFNCENIGKERPRSAWFAALGQTLTTLTCRSIPFGFLYELLRALPNLKRLTIDNCFEYGKAVKPNYELAKLEELTIGFFKNKGHGKSIFPVLQQICPRITILNIREGRYWDFLDQISSFIRAVGKTLVELELSTSDAPDTPDALIGKIAYIKDLHLKRLKILCSEQHLLRLIRRQPTLEQLDCLGSVCYVATLDEISRILPNLKRLNLARVELRQNAAPNSLNFPCAEFIRVRHVDSSECLRFTQCPELRRLEISGAYLPTDALVSLQPIATKLTNISFANCTCDRLTEILTFIQQSRSLTTLELESLRVKIEQDVSVTGIRRSGIRHLKFFDVPKELLSALVELCPDLESLDIKVDLLEGNVAKIGRELKRLRFLALYVSPPELRLTSECLQQISTDFGALRKLQIHACVLPKEKVQEVLQGMRKNVEVSVDYWW
uniref:F-box domain-containing protein n=1 Tax=Culex tarsalis TaxID=7177 RepID=A0A1Q3F549_CULTA